MLGVITSKLARFLGPKGMMPTTRRGGVGQDEELVLRIQEAKGALDWIADSNGRVQTCERPRRDREIDADSLKRSEG